jgi:hypothetical protein
MSSSDSTPPGNPPLRVPEAGRTVRKQSRGVGPRTSERIVEPSRQGREEAYEFVGHDEDARSGLVGAKVAAFGRQSETCSSNDAADTFAASIPTSFNSSGSRHAQRQRHGDAKLTKLLATLADCPNARSVSVYDRCKALYEGLYLGKG